MKKTGMRTVTTTLGFFFPLFLVLLASGPAVAKTVEYDLEIATQLVHITGKAVPAMTINGSIPGPVLRFQEGDSARINVHNKMAVDTSIHWHGVLVPPGMDGVPNVSFPPIAPGATFSYEFPIRQNGTYWYHSHTNLQEQRGVYGAMVIKPPEARVKVDREYVVLLSDWTDEDPDQVLRSLKRGSEWFAIEKGSAQSIFGAARLGMLDDYFKRELQRMPAMDIADIAYDRFLANGSPEIRLDARPGETIRLRIVDGSATTYFHLEFAGGPMQIIAADGIGVEPLTTNRFLIAVAETYDVLIRIPDHGAYEFRATAHDGSGFTSVWLGKGDALHAPAVPKANLYHAMGELSLGKILTPNPATAMGMSDRAVEAGRFDKPGMMAMASMHGMSGMEHGMEPGMGHGMAKPAMNEMSGMQGMGHDPGHRDDAQGMGAEVEPMAEMEHGGDQDGNMIEKFPGSAAISRSRTARPYSTNFRPLVSDVSAAETLAMDGMDQSRPWPPYDKLRAITPTAFAEQRPVREIRLTLDGDMARYVWFLNNRALAESDVIPISRGEIVRFIMINRTMMHHPMHLHGHFFRVVNEQGDYAPLKHTVDVAPMSTTVIEFDANEVGDWFFHCHLLYHMKSGMARVVHYNEFILPAEVAAIRSRLSHDSWYFQGQAEMLSNMTEGFLATANTRQTITAAWESGWEGVAKNEWEGLFTWDIYLNRFLSTFAGLDLLGEGSETDHSRGVLGITYLLPLNIESRYWLDTDGGGRFIFAKEFTLTPRLALAGEAEYDTHETRWEGKVALSYMIARNLSCTGQWHSDFGWGGGAIIRF